MAIRLLLDEHISPQVARLLRARGVDSCSLTEWHGGHYLSRSDEEILRAAHREERTLVSFDVRSIPPLLQRFAESGVEHSGVIFVSTKTIKPGEIAVLAEALDRLLSLNRDEGPDEGLRNKVLLLSKQPEKPD